MPRRGTNIHHILTPNPVAMTDTMPLDESPDTTANQAIFRHITCEKCGKRLLVEAQTGTQTHRCPICQAMLQTTFCDGHLTVTLAS